MVWSQRESSIGSRLLRQTGRKRKLARRSDSYATSALQRGGLGEGVRAMAQPRPRPGEILPPLTQLMDVPMEEPDSPRADRAMMLQLKRDYEALEDEDQVLFWHEVEAMVEQGVLRPDLRRGDPRVMQFSVDELTVQEAHEVRVYMDFLLERSKRTLRTKLRHYKQGRSGAAAPEMSERIDAARQRMKRKKRDFQAGQRQLGTADESEDDLPVELDLFDAIINSGDKSPSSSSE